MKLFTNLVLLMPLATQAFFRINNMSMKCDEQCRDQLKIALSEIMLRFQYGIDTEESHFKEYEPVCLLK